jgi:hypothetical protein
MSQELVLGSMSKSGIAPPLHGQWITDLEPTSQNLLVLMRPKKQGILEIEGG